MGDFTAGLFTGCLIAILVFGAMKPSKADDSSVNSASGNAYARDGD